MSKRIYNKINSFLMENDDDFEMDEFIDLLHEIIVRDPIIPADKTIATRYSLINFKVYLAKMN